MQWDEKYVMVHRILSMLRRLNNTKRDNAFEAFMESGKIDVFINNMEREDE